MKQNNILELKLKFVKESTDTLVKQKKFIMEDTERSKEQLKKESLRIEERMMNENSNKDYLISVKKAVKQSQEMIEMGLQALSNVS